jgi:hypothetical protein
VRHFLFFNDAVTIAVEGSNEGRDVSTSGTTILFAYRVAVPSVFPVGAVLSVNPAFLVRPALALGPVLARSAPARTVVFCCVQPHWQ